MKSRQTKDAEQVHGYYARAWRQHLVVCSECRVAARLRRWASLCPDGAAARAGLNRARDDARRNRQFDRQPIDGQQMLF